MFRMYYLSTAAKELATSDYQDILAKACKNNKALDVTGLLVVKGCFFIQALEGEKENVLTLFEKIKQDKRHHRIVLISQTEVEKRIFSNWEMGFRDISLSGEFPEIDFSDPTFVTEPDALDKIFCRMVAFEVST